MHHDHGAWCDSRVHGKAEIAEHVAGINDDEEDDEGEDDEDVDVVGCAGVGGCGVTLVVC